MSNNKDSILQKPIPENPLADFSFTEEDCTTLKFDKIFADFPTNKWTDAKSLVNQVTGVYQDTLPFDKAFKSIITTLVAVSNKIKDPALTQYSKQVKAYLQQEHITTTFSKIFATQVNHYQKEEIKRLNKEKGMKLAAQLASNAEDAYFDELRASQSHKHTCDSSSSIEAETGSKRSLEKALDSQSKKSKPTTSNGTTSLNLTLKDPKIHRDLSIWEVWESFLYDASNDDSLFLYCPLRYGVITCGEGIIPHESIPVSDYEQLISTKNDEPNSFIMDFQDYISTVLDAETPLEMLDAARKLPAYTKETQASVFYLQDMFVMFSRVVYSPSTDLTHSESVYNGKLIHPSFEAVISLFEDDRLYFIHGEEPLKSMSHVMIQKSPVHDERNCYKADGVIRYMADGDYNVELLLIETSSAFNHASNSKKGFDHHKSTFGLLAMLKYAADKWKKATFDTFSKLKVYFLHAYDDKMRLWSLHSPTPDIYLLEREWSITVPVSFNKREPELLNYILHFNDLKEKVKESMDTIEQLNKEHKYFTKKYRFKPFPSESLLSNIINPTVVKLTEKKNSKGMHDQLPSSLPKK